MAPRDLRIDNYITPRPESFWAWSTTGLEIQWADSGHRPIASLDTLRATMDRLAVKGLPPFGAVLLLLAACGPDWQHGESGRVLLTGYVQYLTEERAKLGIRDHRAADPIATLIAIRVQEVLKGLDHLASLPVALRDTRFKIAAIVSYLLEPVKVRLESDVSELIVAALQAPNISELAHSFHIAGVFDEFMRDVDALHVCFSNFDDERLRAYLRTGVDAPPEPAPVNIPPVDRVRGLLAQLKSDPELSGLARLAGNLMAAIHIPRPLVDPDLMPIGGIAGLTNRGPLDRLLLSELAHDDLTLAVRVALNEALYVKRESPPQHPPRRRLLLLDAGIRLWGVARLFATAVALALGATTDRNAELDAHCPRGSRLDGLDLTTREGLVSALEILEASPNPAGALPQFYELLMESPDSADAILITHADALADDEMRAILETTPRPFLVATVDADGGFQLLLQSARGRRVLGQATLPLELLNPSHRDPDRPVIEAEMAQLPMILSFKKFPLLLPASLEMDRSFHHPKHGVVGSTLDGRIVHCTNSERYAAELTARGPHGRLLFLDVDDAGMVTALFGRGTGAITLLRLSVETPVPAESRVSTNGAGALLTVVRQSDYLLLVYRDRIQALDPSTGRIAHERSLSGQQYTFLRDRFFLKNAVYHAAYYDGANIQLEPVKNVPKGSIALFDRQGLDGPWALTWDWCVVSTVDSSRIEPNPPHAKPQELVKISRCGHRIVTHAIEVRHSHSVMDVNTGRVEAVRTYALHAAEPDVAKCLVTNARHAVRRHIDAIAGGPGEPLHLLRRSREAVLEVSGQIRLRNLPGRSGRTDWVNFERIPVPRGIRYSLRMARFPDGSRAFLDSRGLLHLVSADPTIPEITLVLSDIVSAWLSDGRMTGQPIFVGDARIRASSEIGEQLLNFTRRLK